MVGGRTHRAAGVAGGRRLCPGYTLPLHEKLAQFYGNITAENTIHFITSTVQTGNAHVVVTDLTNQVRVRGHFVDLMSLARARVRLSGLSSACCGCAWPQNMFVSFTRPSGASGPPNAYDRQFTKFHLPDLWAVVNGGAIAAGAAAV